MRHELKILPEYFDDCVNGIKSFEIRKDDRNYQVGDVVILKEWNDKKYTGRSYPFHLIYVLRGAEEFGLMDGYAIIGIK